MEGYLVKQGQKIKVCDKLADPFFLFFAFLLLLGSDLRCALLCADEKEEVVCAPWKEAAVLQG